MRRGRISIFRYFASGLNDIFACWFCVCGWETGGGLYIHLLCVIKTAFVHEFEEYIYTVFNILLPTSCTAFVRNLQKSTHVAPILIKEINKEELNVDVVIIH